MGNGESSYKMKEYIKNYNYLPFRNHIFFGRHQLLFHKKEEKKFVICKDFIFHSDSEYR